MTLTSNVRAPGRYDFNSHVRLAAEPPRVQLLRIRRRAALAALHALTRLAPVSGEVPQTFALLPSRLTLQSRPRTILTNFHGLPRLVEGPSALSRSTIPFSIILCSRSSFIIGTISVQPDFSQRRRFRTRIPPSRRSITNKTFYHEKGLARIPLIANDSASGMLQSTCLEIAAWH